MLPLPDGATVRQVFMMENHDYAYHVWRRLGVHRRTLLHIDAHHDMWWVPERDEATIQNFICRALQHDHVAQVFWVVPDPTWESARTRRPLLRHLRKMAERYPGPRDEVRVASDRISTSLLGKPLTICPLGLLPRIEQEVLLDIDVDFFVIPRVSFRVWDTHARLPWCWPERLLARLGESRVRTAVVTIAYSVEGGYTPLEWKFLGDELATRLQRPSGCEGILEGMRLIREAAVAAHSGDPAAAERLYRRSKVLLPNSAVPCYHLARLYVAMGRVEEGRQCYHCALERDPSYFTPYANAGLWNDWSGRSRAAQREHLRMLELDPHNAYAHFGLARLAARNRRWAEAETAFRRAVGCNANFIDAYRGLAKVLAKQGRHQEAIQAYTHSLKLALDGHKALGAPIITTAEMSLLRDPSHWDIHARLARLYEREGAYSQAINGYRMAIAGGCDGVWPRSRLALLYGRRSQWQKARQEARQAAMKIPADLWKGARRLVYRLQQAVGYE